MCGQPWAGGNGICGSDSGGPTGELGEGELVSAPSGGSAAASSWRTSGPSRGRAGTVFGGSCTCPRSGVPRVRGGRIGPVGQSRRPMQPSYRDGRPRFPKPGRRGLIHRIRLPKEAGAAGDGVRNRQSSEVGVPVALVRHRLRKNDVDSAYPTRTSCSAVRCRMGPGYSISTGRWEYLSSVRARSLALPQGIAADDHQPRIERLMTSGRRCVCAVDVPCPVRARPFHEAR